LAKGDGKNPKNIVRNRKQTDLVNEWRYWNAQKTIAGCWENNWARRKD